MRSLDIAATGMLAQQRNVEVVSNNPANMNTTAFQRRRSEFHDLIYQDLRRVGTTSSDAGTGSLREFPKYPHPSVKRVRKIKQEKKRLAFGFINSKKIFKGLSGRELN